LPIDKPPARGREAAVLRFTPAFVFAARARRCRAGNGNSGREYGPWIRPMNTAYAEYQLGK